MSVASYVVFVLLFAPYLSFSLQKQAYSNILKISPPKTENFQIRNSDVFSYSCSKHRLWYSLEPPCRGGSNEYSQSMFWGKIRKIMYTPVNRKPQFYYIKVRFIGVNIILACFRDLVPHEDCASLVWHFLCIFTYILPITIHIYKARLKQCLIAVALKRICISILSTCVTVQDKVFTSWQCLNLLNISMMTYLIESYIKSFVSLEIHKEHWKTLVTKLSATRVVITIYIIFNLSIGTDMPEQHYENMPIQLYWKF